MLFRPIVSLFALAQLAAAANSCYGQIFGVNQYKWSLEVAEDKTYNVQCGDGYLETLRAECGGIAEWACTRGNQGPAHYEFYTDLACTSAQVDQAILACTAGEQQVNCTRSDGN